MNKNSELFSTMIRMNMKISKASFSRFESKHELMFLLTLSHCINNSADMKDGCVNASSISKYAGFPKSAVSKMLNSLEGKGYITRSHSSSDRRVVYIGISESGKEYLEDVKKQFNAFSDAITNELGKENTEELIRLMEIVISIIENTN